MTWDDVKNNIKPTCGLSQFEFCGESPFLAAGKPHGEYAKWRMERHPLYSVSLRPLIFFLGGKQRPLCLGNNCIRLYRGTTRMTRICSRVSRQFAWFVANSHRHLLHFNFRIVHAKQKRSIRRRIPFNHSSSLHSSTYVQSGKSKTYFMKNDRDSKFWSSLSLGILLYIWCS